MPNKILISFQLRRSLLKLLNKNGCRAGELAIVLAAPAPDFSFQICSGSRFFSQAAPAPGIFFRAARTISFCFRSSSSAEEPAPALALDFFSKRLRLQGAKNTWLLPAPAPQLCMEDLQLIPYFFWVLSAFSEDARLMRSVDAAFKHFNVNNKGCLQELRVSSNVSFKNFSST